MSFYRGMCSCICMLSAILLPVYLIPDDQKNAFVAKLHDVSPKFVWKPVFS